MIADRRGRVGLPRSGHEKRMACNSLRWRFSGARNSLARPEEGTRRLVSLFDHGLNHLESVEFVMDSGIGMAASGLG